MLWFRTAVLTTLVVAVSYAEPTASFTIEADYVNYTGQNNYVRASGNVVVVYKDTLLTAATTTINMQDEQLEVAEGFSLDRGTQKIKGENLTYDLENKEGQATNVDMNLRNQSIRGKTVTIKNDSILIEDSYETTCKVTENHCNHIQAQRLSIYPEWGDVVHDHAVIYFFSIPVMYVPNYVSDLTGDTLAMYSAIPQIGSNPVEGNYLKAGFSYYASEKLNGTLDLHYLSRLGWRTGFTNNYKLDQANRGQIRAHYLSGLGGRASYGWQHRTLLGVPHREKQQIIDDFFRGIIPPNRSSYPEFTLDITSREMVGYQWVSYKPQLSLYTPDYELFSTGIMTRLGLSGAHIVEEDVIYITGQPLAGNRDFLKDIFDGKIYRVFDFAEAGKLTPGYVYKKSGYYDEYHKPVGNWKQSYTYADYKKSWWRFDLTLGYRYTFSETGFSPFLYEVFNRPAEEESSYSLSYQILDFLKVSYTQYFDVIKHKVRDRVYGVGYRLCDWLISMNWADSTGQFTFGVSLQ